MAVKDNSQIAQIEIDRILSKIYKVLPNKNKGDFIAPMYLALCVQNLSNTIPTMADNMDRNELAKNLYNIIKLEFIVLLRIMDYSLDDINKNLGEEGGSIEVALDIFEDEILDLTRTMIKL